MKIEDLAQPFSEELFLQLSKHLLGPEFILSDLAILPASSKFIAKAKYYGKFEDLNLHVLAVEHSASQDARVGVSLDIFKLMKKHSFQNALIAAYSSSSNSWRYSLVTSSLSVNNEGRIVKQFSNPRRYSFLLGPNQKVLTPYKQLIQASKVSDIKDLSKRFSLEVVNNEFYKEIAKLYDELVGTEKAAGVLKHPSHGEVSHEFAVRLIGRIIFCWFLREKKSNSGAPLVPAEILSRDAANEMNYYHSVLAPLFFEILNKHLDSREPKFQEGIYKDIPYLNGGLFNPDNDDHYKFDKALGLSIPGIIDVPNGWLQKLFDLLELYNFTVDENTSYDIDLSIDPEMLGRIFENLLARINPETGETVRKNTGSFYTPREIVEYMVDESLKEYLKEKTGISEDKLSALVSLDLIDDQASPLTATEKKAVTEALSRAKILDPACGSGAFPIGILQKIVFILQQVDPDSKLWLEKQLTGASPELRQHLEREFENKNFDYLRKLGVIRESIYGVDIQPIATEISRLRCFLTLIVDQSVEDTVSNRGIEPLPNLDFKFVTANSLIGIGDNDDKGSLEQTGLFEDSSGISELKELRNRYFTSHNSEREQLKLQFSQRQNEMLQQMIAHHSHGFADITHKISTWNPFNHKITSWFDPEWMFGVSDGFNIIIANPPYLKERDNRKVFESINESPLGKAYHQGKMDFWYYFLHRGIDLVKENGVISFITSRYWINSSGAKKLIARVRQNLVFVDFLDIQKLKVFDNVVGHHMVATYVKRTDRDEFNYKTLHNDFSDLFSKFSTPNIEIQHLSNRKIFSQDNQIKIEEDHLSYKNVIELSNKFTVVQGVVQNPDRVSSKAARVYGLPVGSGVFVLSDSELNSLDLSNDEKKFIRPFYDERSIKKYFVDSSVSQHLIYLTKENCQDISKYPNLMKHLHKFKRIMDVRRETRNGSNSWFHMHWPRKPIYFEGPKVVIPGMFKSSIAAYQETPGYFGLSTNIITAPNRKDLFILVGILNSNFADYWCGKHGKKRGVGVDVGVDRLRHFPFPKEIDLSIAEKIAKIVEVSIKQGRAEDSRINKLIYQLYRFSQDEIEQIEQATFMDKQLEPV